MTTPRIYGLLLRLLPRRRREHDGLVMAQLFADLQADERRERGWTGVVVLWIKEIAGMGRLAVRERFASGTPELTPRRRGPSLAAELRWAWRGVQARRWRAVFVVVLLAVTLAANATTFSVADSLVFRPQPYPEADRIVVLSQSAGSGASIGRRRTAALLRAWREQTDLFVSVGDSLTKTIFLTRAGVLERAFAVDLTVGFLDVLGVEPQWGRGFVDADVTETGGYAAMIREDLARQLFGRPERAVGQRLDSTGGPLTVVGVMSSDFAFPDASYRIWRAMDPAGPLTAGFTGGLPLVARLAPGVAIRAAPAQIVQRAPGVGQAAGLSSYTVEVEPFSAPRAAADRQTLLMLLLGGAVCLLLTACANIASLELAHAVRRTSARAIHLALGASPATLNRVVAMEGGLLIGAALGAGLLLTSVTIQLVTGWLPESIATSTENPVNFDARVVWFCAAAAGFTWLVASLAPLAAMSQSALRPLLTLAGRASTGSSGSTRMRQALTALEVGFAVALVVIGLLHARSYQSLLRVDKGFDSSGLAVISASLPADHFGPGERPAFIKRLNEELNALPGVAGVTNSSPPPEMGDSASDTTIEVDGRPTGQEVGLGRKRVDTAYFSVTRLPLRGGRYLEPGDQSTQAVITESFARRFWPNGNAVGGSFRGAGNSPFRTPVTIVGVVGDFRTKAGGMPDDRDTRLYFYTLIEPPAPALAAPRTPVVDTGGSYSFLSLTVRMDSHARAPAVQAVVQRLDPRLRVSVTMVDDTYAAMNADVLLASRVVGGFSVVALLVAIAGLYGVVAFLVASRTREIGIRMTLGADRRDISRMVLSSSGRLVGIGLVAGIAAAVWASRSIESQLFGVSRFDPLTLALVTGLVAISAFAASWIPARQAARIDPAVTLRAE